MMYDVIIVGSGPAAFTAAIYTGRANLSTLVLEGDVPGGQLMTTTLVENYPGFRGGVQGPDLVLQMRSQAMDFGAEIQTMQVTRVVKEDDGYLFQVHTDEQIFESLVVIVATGADPKRLGIPGEDRLWQNGISTCAVCDGPAPLFRKKPLAIVGGGDSAVEDAMFLTRYSNDITVIVRRDKLRATCVMAQRLLSNPNVKILWNTVVTAAHGKNVLEKLSLKNVQSGVEHNMAASGLFYAIGHKPNSDLCKDLVEIDSDGYIVTEKYGVKTSVSGLFACGDVVDKRFKQAITAAGSGCMAAMESERFLSERT